MDDDSFRVDFTVEHGHKMGSRVRTLLRLVLLEPADRRVLVELADTREQILAILDEDFENDGVNRTHFLVVVLCVLVVVTCVIHLEYEFTQKQSS